MRVIVDTNRILAALLKEGSSRQILTSDNIEFYSADYVLNEVLKYKSEIVIKSGLSEVEIETMLNLAMEKITIISDDKIKSKIKEAIEIMKGIDIKDVPILAAALAIPIDGIWSHDKHFEKQRKIKIFLDKDLISYI
jgi:predicted nucleic acid-binding protein